MTLEAVESSLSNYKLISDVAGGMISRATSSKSSPAEREYWLGMAAYEMKEYGLALDHLRRSEELEATSEVAGRIALTNWRNGNPDDAARWIDRAIERDPSGTLKAYCIGTVSSFSAVKACIELEAGAVTEARGHAEHALRLSPNDALALLTLANCLLLNGDYDGAQQSIERAAEDAPSYLLEQIKVVRTTLSAMQAAQSAGKPVLADYNILMMRRAI